MSGTNRRNFVKTIGAGVTAAATVTVFNAGNIKAQESNPGQKPKVKVRDKFWLWGHAAGSHNPVYNLPRPSRMTPAEAAFYMDIANLIMVVIGDNPAPPFDLYARALSPLKQVVWSIVGDGDSKRVDIEEVIKLAERFPNINGAIMDDFFHDRKAIARHSLDDIARFRQQLRNTVRPLDLWVVLYDHQLDWPVQEHLSLCDKVTFWTWEADNLKNLENNFSHFEQLVPDTCSKILGCYMWDYGKKRPMPLAAMQKQNKLGLRWLQEGRIQGMIFLASCICDLDIDTVEWTKRWIAEVGDREL